MKLTKAKLKQIIKEEFNRVMKEGYGENEAIRAKILHVIDSTAGSTEASEEGTQALRLGLGKLGFDVNEMRFNEDSPASLNFGDDWQGLGEWVLVLEGKCLGRGPGACLREI
jgi:DNA primase large subunit